MPLAPPPPPPPPPPEVPASPSAGGGECEHLRDCALALGGELICSDAKVHFCYAIIDELQAIEDDRTDLDGLLSEQATRALRAAGSPRALLRMLRSGSKAESSVAIRVLHFDDALDAFTRMELASARSAVATAADGEEARLAIRAIDMFINRRYI